MKKIPFIFIIFAFLSLCGCNINTSQYINLSKKPCNNHYTNILYKKLNENNNYTLHVFDTNVYKDIEVTSDEKLIISNFITSLNSDNYNNSTNNTLEETYRIQVIFSDGSRFLIKIFDENYVTLSPWDGVYSEDYINISNVPLAYNLYDFCNHIHNNNPKPSAN